MPVLNRVAEMQDEIAGWRRTLHQQPELDFAVYKTAEFVQQKLAEFGVDEIATGIGRTGVVGIIKGSKGAGATIGLRADMDALPMQEITGKAYQSQTPGVAHACGHDGHTAMLLGAAKYLAETRNFAGSVAVIFQPAEEGGGGGREMVQDGMMDRFGIDRVFGMHNLPNLPVGKFAIKPGAIMAATAEFTIVVKGRGGHAAMPHTTIDPISIGTQLVTALQSIVSRNANPVESLVVTVTKFHAGDAYNVIPNRADIAGTVRALKQDLAVLAEKRMKEICNGLAVAHGIEIELDYDANYPVTMNDPVEAVFAGAVAADVAGAANVDLEAPPLMAGEDFSYMLEARPGAFIFLGNGGSAPLHHPAYDFDDTAIAHGVSYWIRIAETALAT